MKPCPLCTAAVPDDVSFSPGDMFCGACGRNAAQVRQSPSLPPGATAFAHPSQFQQQAQTPPPQSPWPQQPPPPQNPWPQPPPDSPQTGFQQPGNFQPGGFQQQPGQQPGWPPNNNQPGVWPPPPGGQPFPQGMGTMTQAPPGLNWGAFWLPVLWGPFNKAYIGLAALVSFIPYIGWIASLGVSIYLLIKGNELAWRSGRPWQSVEQFQAVQKAWAMWGWISLVISIVLSVIFGFIYAAALSAGGGVSPYAPRSF